VADLYPGCEPYDGGMLEVGDGNRVYWEVSGNPDGKPAVGLHGGPGSGTSPAVRRYFDPAAYRIVLFDQRNCGRSLPHAADGADLAANTTDHLIADIERLRRHLGIERWLVRGGSWGSVLALAYAKHHPDRVSELIVMGVATGRRAEIDLLTRGLGPLFPDAWARFSAGGGHAADLPDAYARLLEDPATRDRAARDWCDWEQAAVPTGPRNPRWDDPRFRLGFARIVTHYWRHGSFLADGELTRDPGVPGVIVQGVLDLGNLIGTPWLLHHAWPAGDLVLVDDVGHDNGAPLVRALVDATDRFRRT
jgi:proline iminopeptidase